jgi:hypothetical protein
MPLAQPKMDPAVPGADAAGNLRQERQARIPQALGGPTVPAPHNVLPYNPSAGHHPTNPVPPVPPRDPGTHQAPPPLQQLTRNWSAVVQAPAQQPQPQPHQALPPPPASRQTRQPWPAGTPAYVPPARQQQPWPVGTPAYVPPARQLSRQAAPNLVRMAPMRGAARPVNSTVASVLTGIALDVLGYPAQVRGNNAKKDIVDMAALVHDPDLFIRSIGVGQNGQWLGDWHLEGNVWVWIPDVVAIMQQLSDSLASLQEHRLALIATHGEWADFAGGYVLNDGDASLIQLVKHTRTDDYVQKTQIWDMDGLNDEVLASLMSLGVLWGLLDTREPGWYCDVCKQGPYEHGFCPTLRKTTGTGKHKVNYQGLFTEHTLAGFLYVCLRCRWHEVQLGRAGSTHTLSAFIASRLRAHHPNMYCENRLHMPPHSDNAFQPRGRGDGVCRIQDHLTNSYCDMWIEENRRAHDAMSGIART